MLPKVWLAIEFLHANTLEIPVYWEQFEPEPGKFDTSVIDTLLSEAREHNVRLVLLWFGTWKNGSSHYEPLWMKSQPDKYPRIIGKNGRRVDSPSPHAPATLQADTRAFSAFMRHLKSADPRHTVIMVQVENEPGSWGSVRDYSPDAQKLFEGAVPAELLKALGTNAAGSGSWSDVFGPNADEYFHAWSIARYIGQVAAAGKAEYPLPLYVNAALRDPLTPGSANTYESGGATDNVLDIWKAAAPAIDLLAPDIYQGDSARYRKVLELYGRPDNALFVPETRANGAASRWCFAALGRQAIGWSPFGLDYTAYSADPFGLPRTTEEQLAPIALNFKMLEPLMREIARLNFEGRVQAVAEEKMNPCKPSTSGTGRPSFPTAALPAETAALAATPNPSAAPSSPKLAKTSSGSPALIAGLISRPPPADSANSSASKKSGFPTPPENIPVFPRTNRIPPPTRKAPGISCASGMATKPTGASTFPPRPRSSASPSAPIDFMPVLFFPLSDAGNQPLAPPWAQATRIPERGLQPASTSADRRPNYCPVPLRLLCVLCEKKSPFRGGKSTSCERVEHSATRPSAISKAT